MTAPTRTRSAARHRADDAAHARIVERLRSQFPELGESEIEAAVGSPRRDPDNSVGGAGGVELAERAADSVEPRRHRA
jgi:hypothetical protein